MFGKSEQAVTEQGKNLLSLYSNNIITNPPFSTQTSGTSQSIYKDYDIIYGATRNGFISSDRVSDVNINAATNTITLKTTSSGWGWHKNIKIQ